MLSSNWAHWAARRHGRWSVSWVRYPTLGTEKVSNSIYTTICVETSSRWACFEDMLDILPEMHDNSNRYKLLAHCSAVLAFFVEPNYAILHRKPGADISWSTSTHPTESPCRKPRRICRTLRPSCMLFTTQTKSRPSTHGSTGSYNSKPITHARLLGSNPPKVCGQRN